MGAPFTGRTGSQDEKTKAGANWKRLQKTLTTTTSPEDDGRVIKRSRRSSTSRPSSTTSRRITSVRAKDDKMKVAKIIDESNARDSASPAPTTLPWFAEDLSPEDLALVRKQSADRTPSKDSATDAGTSAVSVASLTDEEALRRRQLILGGQGLEQGQDATPDAAKAEAGKYVAIDCEMVGVGPNGSESVLARVSIVNWHGAVLLDTFVRTRETVTDYRTWVSGVRPADLRKAPSFDEVQANVAKLIEGRILVGHALHNDLRALLLSHPHWLIRDTASYSGARKIANTKYPSLRKLVALQLGIEIQQAGAPHSSVEDARATMALYRTFHAEWQKTLSSSVAARSTTRQQKNHGSSSSPQIIGKGWKAAAGATGKRDASSASISSTSGTAKKKRSSADDVDWWKTV